MRRSTITNCINKSFHYRRPYNLIDEFNMNSIQWPLIFTVARGHRLLHDVGLLSRPDEPDVYAKTLWSNMLTVDRL